MCGMRDREERGNDVNSICLRRHEPGINVQEQEKMDVPAKETVLPAFHLSACTSYFSGVPVTYRRVYLGL